MAEKPPEGQWVNVFKFSLEHNPKYIRPGQSVWPLMIEANYLPKIGKVISYWGMWDSAMTQALAFLESALSVDKQEEPSYAFNKRVKRLRKNARGLFGLDDPKTKFFLSITDEALEIAWQRNAIAHGDFHVQVTNNNPENTFAKTFYVKATRGSEKINLDVTEDRLDFLWMTLGYMINAIYGAFDPSEANNHHILSSPDRRVLQEIGQKGSKNAPKPNKRGNQPPPSPQ